MSTRTSNAASLLLLAACSQDAAEAPAADPDDLIECALGGAVVFTRDCVIESGPGWIGGQNGLVVRHPDGSFRRLIAFDDGRGFETADGADRAAIAVTEDSTEVRVGPDRYRFPGKLALRDTP
jgi:hypothetical protein